MSAVRALAREPSLRRASPDDCEAVWRWNFAPEVRHVSGSSRTVTYPEHSRWYAHRLAQGDAPIWIVLDERARPVGVVRLDLRPDRTTRIAIALAADARGRGIGRRAIELACQSWQGPIEAEIRRDNTPSVSCFEACGFEPVDERGDLVLYRWRP